MIRVSDPGAFYRSRREEVDRAMARVAESGAYILGEEVAAFEEEFASWLGVPHASGVASGTDAIECALRAIGVRPGDEVYTVSHTALATVAAIIRCGAVPVLIDVDPATLTMDPASLEEALEGRELAGGARRGAVVPVHLYGRPAEIPALLEIAGRHGLPVVEDCAQAHGAALDGRPAGGWGDVGTFSFYPTKNLGGMGDGGMVVCRDQELASMVRLVRQYGRAARCAPAGLGMNSRLDELQAAILRVHLRHLEADNERLRERALLYDERLAETTLRIPSVPTGGAHAYHQYVVRTAERDSLRRHLEREGIETAVHYPIPCHLQPGYRERVVAGSSLEETERAAAEVVSLPMHPFLAPEDVVRVADAVQAWDSGRPGRD